MMKKLSRRRFVGTTAAAALAVPTVLAIPIWGFQASASEDGFIDLTARPFDTRLVGPSGPQSELWGYNGTSPGPLLRVQQGGRLRVRFRNELPEPSTIHWHGIRVENGMDGVSGLTQDPVPPGETFEYDFIVPDAGTYWFHAHHNSWKQVARGLYGALVVDEPTPLVPPEADTVLVIDDWRINDQGRFDHASLGQMMDWSHSGRLGNFITVNGQLRPTVIVNQNQWHRLRLINASNARVLALDLKSFDAKIIAYDGQSVGEARQLDYAPFLLGPAQRVDLLVKYDTVGQVVINEVSGRDYELVRLNVSSSLLPSVPVPAIIPSSLAAPDLDSAETFELNMEGGAMGQMGPVVYNGRVQSRQDMMLNQQIWSFNGVANIADAPFFEVATGTSVIMTVRNNTRFEHAMHLHGHHFKILERNDAVDAEQAWRDTFLIVAGGSTKIAFIADNPGKWLFHCHMLEHAAAGMTTWINVT